MIIPIDRTTEISSLLLVTADENTKAFSLPALKNISMPPINDLIV